MQDEQDQEQPIYPDEFGKVLEDPERVRKVPNLFLAATEVFEMDWLYGFEYVQAHIN